jgi:hypothetical protein
MNYDHHINVPTECDIFNHVFKNCGATTSAVESGLLIRVITDEELTADWIFLRDSKFSNNVPKRSQQYL